MPFRLHASGLAKTEWTRQYVLPRRLHIAFPSLLNGLKFEMPNIYYHITWSGPPSHCLKMVTCNVTREMKMIREPIVMIREPIVRKKDGKITCWVTLFCFDTTMLLPNKIPTKLHFSIVLTTFFTDGKIKKMTIGLHCFAWFWPHFYPMKNTKLLI